MAGTNTITIDVTDLELELHQAIGPRGAAYAGCMELSLDSRKALAKRLNEYFFCKKKLEAENPVTASAKPAELVLYKRHDDDQQEVIKDASKKYLLVTPSKQGKDSVATITLVMWGKSYQLTAGHISVVYKQDAQKALGYAVLFAALTGLMCLGPLTLPALIVIGGLGGITLYFSGKSARAAIKSGRTDRESSGIKQDEIGAEYPAAWLILETVYIEGYFTPQKRSSGIKGSSSWEEMPVIPFSNPTSASTYLRKGSEEEQKTDPSTTPSTTNALNSNDQPLLQP